MALRVQHACNYAAAALRAHDNRHLALDTRAAFSAVGAGVMELKL
jgi:hypothetical protein